MVFAVEKSSVCGFCSDVNGSCEVQAVGSFVELE